MTKTYRDNELDCEIMVEEMSRKEALEYAKDFVEGIEFTSKNFAYDSDMTVYIEYNDGSYFYKSCCDECGTFKKINIKYIELDDGFEYYIYGAYRMNENLIPEAV